MPDLVLNPLQQRLFEILDADATLTALIGSDRIFDNAPDDIDMPYVVIGDDALNGWDGHTFDGFEGPVTLHVWTEGEGKKDNKKILNRLYQLLHNIDIAIPSFNTITFRCIFNEVLIEPEDNRTYHGVQRYNLTVTGV